jgi:hypothetical protein
LNSPTNETFLPGPANITLDAFAEDFDANVVKVDFFVNDTVIATVTNELSGGTFNGIYVWTNVALGIYSVSVSVTTDIGQTNITDPAVVIVHTNTGFLSVSAAEMSGATNLTAAGIADWAHWGLYWASTFNHKAGVQSQIGNYTDLNFGTPFASTGAGSSCSWTDGTPITSMTATNKATFTYDSDFEFGVAASTNATPRTLQVFAGTTSARARFLAYLSDFSAPPVILRTADTTTNMAFTVNYRAGTTNQRVIIRYGIEFPDFFGTVNLQASALSTGNAPPQSAITNLPNACVLQFPTNLVIGASASDPDGNISKVEFFDGTTKIGEATNSSYTLVWTNTPAGLHKLSARATDNGGATFTSPSVHVFVTTGGGVLSGSVGAPSATVNLATEGRTDWEHWGLINFNSFNHRALVPQRISDATKIGDGNVHRLTGYPTSFSWTSGTPIASENGSTTGIFVYGLDNGFQLSVPADTLRRRLKVYVSAYAAAGLLEAFLSDASAAAYVDRSISNVFDSTYGVYSIDYAAASANKTLTIRFTAEAAYDSEFGNVTLEAATLAMLDNDLRNPQKNGDAFQFSLPSDARQPYAIEYTDILPATNWLVLTNVLGNGALTNLMDPFATNAQRFYRAKSD